MLGIQVTGDLGTIVTQARKNGLIVLTAGSDVIRLLPPLTITEEEIERAVSILAECLSWKLSGRLRKENTKYFQLFLQNIEIVFAFVL